MRDVAHEVPPEGLAIRLERAYERVLAFELVGRLDIETSERFDRAMREAVARRPERIVVDLRRVDYLDSSGLKTLILAQREAGAKEVEICLVPGSSHVRRVLRTTGVADRFRLLDWSADPGP